MRKKPESVNRLDQKQMWKLTNLVQDRFVASGLSDVEFAALAENELKMPVTWCNVERAREVLEIPSRRAILRQSEDSTEIEKLRLRVETLERRLNTYFSDGKKT